MRRSWPLCSVEGNCQNNNMPLGYASLAAIFRTLDTL